VIEHIMFIAGFVVNP